MDGSSDLELRDYLDVLWRRKLVVVVCAALAMGVALAVSMFQTATYEAEATIVFQERASVSILDPATRGPDIETEVEVLASRPVQEITESRVGHPVDLSAGVRPDANVLEARARSTDPERAAGDATTYAETYLEGYHDRTVNDLLAASEVLQARIDDLDAQLGALPEEAAAERTSLETQRSRYRLQLDELQAASTLLGGPQLLDPAVPPGSPISPRPVRNAALALVLGLVAGVGLAFLREYLDDSITTKADLEQASEGSTVVGLIPAIAGWKERGRAEVVAATAPSSAPAEAYRTLRTSVQFLGLDRPIRTLQVTSAVSEESKTTTVSNLGVVLARAGQRVVMVCCDLRRPRLHEFFGLPNAIGLTTVIIGEASMSNAVQAVPGHPNLMLLASGEPPPNPSELLGAQRMRETLEACAANADIVLLDSPPVLPVTDAIVLSGLVDATLLVATVGRSTKKGVHRAVEMLRQVDAPLVGTVLNGVDDASVYGAAAGYGYPSRGSADNGARRLRKRA